MKTTRISMFVAAICALWPLSACAQPQGGTESNLGLGATSRGIALGGAWLARVGDASAVYWNPGRLSVLERGAVVVTHAPIGFGDATQTFAAVAYPTLRAGTFGLGFMRLATGGIDGYDADSRPTGALEFAETALYMSWGRGFDTAAWGRFEVGASGKTLTQSLTPWSTTGAGLDLGLGWSPRGRDDLALGVVIRDAVAPRLQLQQDSDHAPATWQMGASWRPRFAARMEGELHVALDRVSTRGWSPRLGLECRYRSRLALRLGASRQGVAFGLGLGWQAYELDYAYLSRAEAATHPVSLAADWGATREARLAGREAARAAAMRGELQSMLETRLAAAQTAYDRGDYAAAIDEWKIVAGIDPTEERAERGLAAAGARLSEVQARALADRDQAAARAAEFELGLRAYGRSEHALAREVWTRLLAEDPTNTDVRTYLEKTEQALRAQVGAEAEEARRLEASRDWVAALAAWSRVHAADAHHPEAMPALARCRTALERGRRSESPRPDAPSAARAVATPRPTSQAFRDALAAYSDGDLQRAVVLLRSVRRDDPNHSEAQRLLAKAERALQPLGPEDRTRVRELYLRGMGHFTAHQFEAAIAEWTKILEIDPGNASVYQNIREARARLRAVQP